METYLKKGFKENKDVAKKGGKVAKAARVQLEKTTGKKVVTKLNAKSINTDNKELEE